MMDNKSVRMIVVTGGIQSGKDDLIKRIDREFSKKGFTVLSISDTAADIVEGGIIPDKFINEVSFPTLLYELQHAKETVYKKAAYQMTAGPILIVCERAIQDSKAFVGDELYDEALKSYGVEERDILGRYDAVIHMVTSAKGARETFDILRSGTPDEITPEMAAQLDDLLIDAWSGHPHHLIIDNSTAYPEKLERAIDALKGMLCEAELAKKPEQATEQVPEPEREAEPECGEEVPEVPVTDGCMTLQDLASDQFSLESEALQLSEIETNKAAMDFFGHQSLSGAIADMLRFARHLDVVIQKHYYQEWINWTECANGHLSITYVRIFQFTTVGSGCYDGGGGNYELEEDGATLKTLHFEKMDDVNWDELKRAQINEKDFERYRRQWGHSDYQDYGSTPVILSGNGLYMLNPFGLKGLYRMRITSERVYD